MKTSRQYYQSSSFKMAALFTTLLGIAALLLGYFLYDFGRQNFTRETEAAIDSEIRHILAIAPHGDHTAIIDYINQRKHTPNTPFYLYQEYNGTVLAGNISTIPTDITPIKEGLLGFTLTTKQHEHSVAAKVHSFSNGTTLLVARDITTIMEYHHRLKHFALLILIFMLLVVCISFLISTFVVSRINKMVTIAKDIIHTGDLSQRITVDSNWDDLSYLAKTLNALLERIDSLMQAVRDVGDNIAHDLRMPITRLRGELETLNHNGTMDSLIAEVDGILHMFNSLLRIANIEKGKRDQSFTSLEITGVLQDVIELYEPLADMEHITIISQLTDTPPLWGDRDLLFQMCANIVDNAIKFSTPHSTITIKTTATDNAVIVDIADCGIGISPEDEKRVFEPFYRADKSRAIAGNGLGLSMVNAIAALHHATISLHDNHPGLRVTLTLPTLHLCNKDDSNTQSIME